MVSPLGKRARSSEHPAGLLFSGAFRSGQLPRLLVSWLQGAHPGTACGPLALAPPTHMRRDHIMRRGLLDNPEPSRDTWIGPVLVVLAVSLALVIAAFLMLPLIIAAFLVLPTLV
jgi:hypothetical protein